MEADVKPRDLEKARNPFGLTDRQVEAVRALVKHGNDKGVASALGNAPHNASRLLLAAQKAMGVQTRVHLALKWERELPREIRKTGGAR